MSINTPIIRRCNGCFVRINISINPYIITMSKFQVYTQYIRVDSFPCLIDN